MSGFSRILTQVSLTLISCSLYTLFFSWQFGVLVVAILVTHELGHLWAAHRFKLGPKGIFLIPFLGAVTLHSEYSPTRGKEFIAAIAGPATGTVFAIALGAMYWATGAAVFAAAAFFAAAINLLNLFPIGFLDGGHLLKQVAFSVNPRRQMSVLFCGLATALWIGLWVDPERTITFGMLGFIWLGLLRGNMRYVQKVGRPGGNIYDQNDAIATQVSMSPKVAFAAFGAHVGLAVLLSAMVLFMNDEPGARAAFQTLLHG